MLEWIQQYSSVISLVAMLALVSITAYYAYLTKRVLQATDRQSKLGLAPVIGIEISGIGISEVFGSNRRNMSVRLELTNVGNAPAIEVFVDSEVLLRYSQINGHEAIPARYEPDMVPFLRPGESKDECSPNFGNKLIAHFFDDVKESSRLNWHRIATDPTKEPYRASILRIFVYYRNSLGQYFKSFYEVEIDLDVPNVKDPIPKDDETVEVSMTYVPRPQFHAGTIQREEMQREINLRNNKRNLCGW